jgi:hypothetical protein
MHSSQKSIICVMTHAVITAYLHSRDKMGKGKRRVYSIFSIEGFWKLHRKLPFAQNLYTSHYPLLRD